MSEQLTETKVKGDGAPGETSRSGPFFRPNCDLLEREDELLILADVPGAKGSEIEVKFEDGVLAIHAPIEARQPQGLEYALQEYGVGDFYRTFKVSEAIDASKITAECTDGVLTLHLPKSAAARARRIAVN